jgi:hypothetical protein
MRYAVGVSLGVAVLIASALAAGAAGKKLPNAGNRECSAVMAWGRLHVYERSSNGKLMHRLFDQAKKTWSKMEQVGDLEISSSPSAVMSDGGTRLVVFFRDADGNLGHIYRDKETPWSAPIPIGSAEMQSGPTAVVAGGDVLSVFARDKSGKLMIIYYDKEIASWTEWNKLD